MEHSIPVPSIVFSCCRCLRKLGELSMQECAATIKVISNNKRISYNKLRPFYTGENWIRPDWDRSSFGSVPKLCKCLHGIDPCAFSLMSRILLKGMRKGFAPFVVRVTRSCHHETASVSFSGYPLCFVPAWDRSSFLHQDLTESIPKWPGQRRCKSKAYPFQFGIDSVLGRSIFLTCKQG